jgi:NitT/TauT family transport system substrate-binding protein
MTGDGIYEPVRFNGFPELKEAFLSGYMPATFILAPLAMSLKEAGVPVKIVYLGHRDGTTLVVHKDSGIYRLEDLRGKRVAFPNRYSNQRLLMYKALKDRKMPFESIELIEMPPPDMPTALYTRSIDGFIVGEPYPAQTQVDGYGRVLYFTKDIWPNFISCVLVAHEDAIKYRRPEIQKLVDGIAKSGKWLDQSMDHRMQAAGFVAQHYYNQHPKLLQWALSKPPDRVKYTNLRVVAKDLDEIYQLGVESGIFRGGLRFEDYADPSFVRDDTAVRPYQWEAPKEYRLEVPK